MDWQVMSQELRELYISNAANEKAPYDIRVIEYRKTEMYAAYQKYIAEFLEKKAKKESVKREERGKEIREGRGKGCEG